MPREALVSREHEGNGPSEFDSSMDAETNTHRCDLARARKARASRPRGQKKHPCCAAPRGKVKHNTRTGGSALEVRAVCVSKERLYTLSVFNRACRRGTGRRGIGRRCSGWHAELLKKLDVPHAGGRQPSLRVNCHQEEEHSTPLQPPGLASPIDHAIDTG